MSDEREWWQVMLGIESSDQFIRRHQRRRAEATAAHQQRCTLPGPVADSPPAHACQSILIGRTEGRPALFEYSDEGARLRQLTWPNERHRSYYRVGDIVLLTEVTETHLGRIYPELRSDGAVSLVELALGFLGESPPTYRIGKKIIGISAEGTEPGSGTVRTRGVVFFGGEAVELESEHSVSAEQFGIQFTMMRVANRLSGMIPILEALAQLAGDAATVGTGSIIRRGGRRIARYTLARASRLTARRLVARRALRLLLSGGARFAIRTGAAFVRGMGNEFRRRDRENQMRRRGGARELRMDELRPYLIAGVREMVSSLFDSATDAARGAVRSQAESEVQSAIVEEVVRIFLLEPARVVSDAAFVAYEQTERNPERFGEVFAEQVKDKALEVLTSVLRNSTDRAVDAVTD